MRHALIVCTITLTFSPTVLGACQKVSRVTFAKDLASAHASSTLPSLDKKYPKLGPFQIFIEHSIAGERDGSTIFVTVVPSFGAIAELLHSRQTEGLPQPESRPLRSCANGVCSYDFLNGIQHNTLYLKELRYNDYKDCLEVETIWFLDGD